MIRINLLSPLDKENLRWEKINNVAGKSITWILLAEAIFVGVFLFSVEYLKTEEKVVAAQLDIANSLPQTQEVAAIEQESKLSASKVESIYAVRQGQVEWTLLFEKISEMTPAGVRLESISMQEESAKTVKGEKADAVKPAQEKKTEVQITGNAKTREMLLAFENKLKGESIFSGLEYDDANYVQSIDIDFRYSFQVPQEELLK